MITMHMHHSRLSQRQICGAPRKKFPRPDTRNGDSPSGESVVERDNVAKEEPRLKVIENRVVHSGKRKEEADSSESSEWETKRKRMAKEGRKSQKKYGRARTRSL